MKWIIFAIFCLTTPAYAEEIAGLFFRQGASLTLNLENDKEAATAVQLEPASYQVRSELYRIDSGDFLVVQGERKGGSFLVNGIETVGIKSLTGVWRTESWQIYEFVDFTHLRIYHGKLQEYGYRIVPGASQTWTLFVTNRQTMRLGTLIFQGGFIKIEFIDPVTGEPSDRVKLQRWQ